MPDDKPRSTISTRIEHRSRSKAKGQRRHDMREGPQPKYVNASRTTENSILVEPTKEAALDKLCEKRAAQLGRQRARKSNSAIATCGIVTFSKEAQPIVNALPRAEQDRLFLETAERLAEKMGTTLHGAVVHRDETAIHMHYRLAAVRTDGRPVSKVVDTRALQDAAAAVWSELGIERGTPKQVRKDLGEPESSWTHRTVKELHEDLPGEIEAAKSRVAEAEKKAAEAEDRAEKTAERLEKAQEKATAAEGESERLEKRVATYQRRADAAEKRAKDAEAEAKRLQEQLDAVRAKAEAEREKAETAQQRRIAAEKKATAAEGESERLEKRVATYQRRADAAEKRAKDAEAEAKRLQEQLDAVRRELDVARTEIKQLGTTLPEPVPVRIRTPKVETKQLKTEGMFAKSEPTPVVVGETTVTTNKRWYPEEVIDDLAAAAWQRHERAVNTRIAEERAAAKEEQFQADAREVKEMLAQQRQRDAEKRQRLQSALIQPIAAPEPIKDATAALWASQAQIVERYRVQMQVHEKIARVPPQNATDRQIAAALYRVGQDQGWERMWFHVPDAVADEIISMAIEDGRLYDISFKTDSAAALLDQARAERPEMDPEFDPLGEPPQRPANGPGFGL